jgi:UDPglucose 6-dehydrogenase
VNLGIVGYGTVGRALARLFERGGHRVAIYDKYVDTLRSRRCLDAVNGAELAFVAVPTPFDADSGRCDVSKVREAVAGITVPLCIKSTVPPGTTDALIRETAKPIGYSPEYIGESAGHPWQEADACGFVVLAGDSSVRALVRRAYAPCVSAELRYVEVDAPVAELAKYMENCFLATKVAFVNQFADIAEAAGIDFAAVRDVFLLDPRVGESHTQVTVERGFGGRCLPKDLRSLVAWTGDPSKAPLIQAVLDFNARLAAVPR